MKKLNFKTEKLICILIIICVQFIVGIYSYDLWESIDAKKETTYQVKEDYVDTVLESDAEYQYNLILYVKNPKRIWIDVNVEGQENDKEVLECRIIDDNANTVFEKRYTLNEIQEAEGVEIDGRYFSELTKKDYKCILKNCTDGEINVKKSYWDNLSVIEYFDYNYSKMSMIFLYVANIMLFAFNLFLCSRIKTSIKFCATAGIIGVLAVVVVAPCSAPDEWRHFVRAYDIASGDLVCKDEVEILGGIQTTGECTLPVEYLEIRKSGESNGSDWTAESVAQVSIPHMKQMLQQKELSGELTKTPMHGTYAKSPLEYIPQVFGILIGKALSLPPIIVFYLARLMNVLICTLIGVCAIKITPTSKKILACLYFIPVMSFLRGAVSTDGILYSVTLFTIAYAMKIAKKKDKISWKELCVFGICATYIGILKLPYILIPLILMGILVEGNKKERTGIILKILGIMIIAMSIRSIVANYFSSGIIGMAVTEESESLLTYTVTHFWSVLSLLVRTFCDTLVEHVTNAVAWPVIQLPFVIYFSVMIWVVISDEKPEWSKIQRSILLAGVPVVWAGIVFTFYTVSDVGATSIWGIQGRYMTPIFPLAAIGIKTVVEKRKRLLDRYMYLIVFNCNIIYFIKILQMYWCR